MKYDPIASRLSKQIKPQPQPQPQSPIQQQITQTKPTQLQVYVNDPQLDTVYVSYKAKVLLVLARYIKKHENYIKNLTYMCANLFEQLGYEVYIIEQIDNGNDIQADHVAYKRIKELKQTDILMIYYIERLSSLALESSDLFGLSTCATIRGIYETNNNLDQYPGQYKYDGSRCFAVDKKSNDDLLIFHLASQTDIEHEPGPLTQAFMNAITSIIKSDLGLNKQSWQYLYDLVKHLLNKKSKLQLYISSNHEQFLTNHIDLV
jgi:hypothetical protein